MMTFDDIVKLCNDFYKEEEILAARNLLESSGHKLSKRQGCEKLRRTLEAPPKYCLRRAAGLC